MAVQPRRNADVMPLPAWLGQYAGTPWRHPFRSYVTGAGAPQCGGCFGWPDDPRHWTGVRRG